MFECPNRLGDSSGAQSELNSRRRRSHNSRRRSPDPRRRSPNSRRRHHNSRRRSPNSRRRSPKTSESSGCADSGFRGRKCADLLAGAPLSCKIPEVRKSCRKSCRLCGSELCNQPVCSRGASYRALQKLQATKATNSSCNWELIQHLQFNGQRTDFAVKASDAKKLVAAKQCGTDLISGVTMLEYEALSTKSYRIQTSHHAWFCNELNLAEHSTWLNTGMR